MVTLGELMTPNPVVVRRDTPVSTCAHLLVQHDVRHLPVVRPTGEIDGMLYDHDVFQRGSFTGEHHDVWIELGPSPGGTARDVAAPARHLGQLDDPWLPVVSTVVAAQDDVVTVLGGTRVPVGIVTDHDLMRYAQDRLPPDLSVRAEATARVQTVPLSAAASDAWASMLALGIRHLVVADGDVAYGIVSMRDLVVAATAHRDQPLRELLLEPRLHTLPVQTTLREAARLLAELRVGCLPLVDHGNHIRGIVTRTDVIRALIAVVEQDELFSAE